MRTRKRGKVSKGPELVFNDSDLMDLAYEKARKLGYPVRESSHLHINLATRKVEIIIPIEDPAKASVDQ